MLCFKIWATIVVTTATVGTKASFSALAAAGKPAAAWPLPEDEDAEEDEADAEEEAPFREIAAECSPKKESLPCALQSNLDLTYVLTINPKFGVLGLKGHADKSHLLEDRALVCQRMLGGKNEDHLHCI